MAKERTIENLRVLIIDDHSTALTTIRLMLDQLRVASVHTAPDGKVALDLLDETGIEKFDMILCDWNMPHISGVELLRQVRSVDKTIPFIMITGRGDAASIAEAQKSGVSGYILKPFSLSEIEKKIMHFVRG